MSGARQITRPTAKLTAEQEPFLAVRSLATSYASGYRIESHQHPWHQFLYAISGAMTVSTDQSSWMIPIGRAVFIPAGCACDSDVGHGRDADPVFFSGADGICSRRVSCRGGSAAPAGTDLADRGADGPGFQGCA